MPRCARDARKVWLMGESRKKDDRLDAQTLARLARIDPELLYPVKHRSVQAQADLMKFNRSRQLTMESIKPSEAVRRRWVFPSTPAIFQLAYELNQIRRCHRHKFHSHNRELARDDSRAYSARELLRTSSLNTIASATSFMVLRFWRLWR